LTSKERKEYMRQYRKEHREQIKATAANRNIRKAKENIDRIERSGNAVRIITRDGRKFDFIRPFPD